MSDQPRNTLTVGPDESHRHVTLIVGTRGVLLSPYDALSTSAIFLDAALAPDDDDRCIVDLPGHPKLLIEADTARAFGRHIATIADHLLVEAEQPF